MLLVDYFVEETIQIQLFSQLNKTPQTTCGLISFFSGFSAVIVYVLFSAVIVYVPQSLHEAYDLYKSLNFQIDPIHSFIVMDEDWDLYAVVRSCKTSTTTATSSASATESIPANINMTNSEDDAYFPNFESLGFGNNENQFFIHQALNNRNIHDPFQRLQEVQGEFTLNNQSSSTIPSITPTIGFQHQPSQNLQQIVHGEQFYPSTISFPVVNPQPVRPRRRKNQQSKVVRQMTQDQLSTDSWAWRKYGQKPIKGSPYPRNYYKCSTSKGCAARKQVERNPTDPNVYIVSYTGEHTHPRPTHRSSLAGSTRTKFSTPLTNNTTTSNNNLASEAIKAPCSSSSPVASGSSFSPSPNTTSKDGDNNDEDNDDNVDDVFIPNVVMDEDIFKGFGDINEMNIYTNGSGDDDQTGVSSG